MGVTKDKYIQMIKDVIIKDILIKSMYLDDVKFPLDSDDELGVYLDYNCDKFYFNEKNNIKDLVEFYPEFKVKIKCKDYETVNLKFELRVVYSIKDIKQYEDEYIIKFMNDNLPVNIWPYAREIVSSMTTRIGYPALLIEPYRMSF